MIGQKWAGPRLRTLLTSLLAVGVLHAPVVSTAALTEIAPIGGIGYFYDDVNDKSWVDHQFAKGLTSAAAETLAISIGLQLATLADIQAMIDSMGLGTTGPAQYNHIRDVTNSTSAGNVLGWFDGQGLFNTPIFSYQFYAGGCVCSQPVGMGDPNSIFPEGGVWAHRSGDIRLVPEPGTAALLAFGLAGLGVRRRGSRRRIREIANRS